MAYLIESSAVREAFKSASSHQNLFLGRDRAEPVADANPNWINAALRDSKIHDEDFIVFSMFQNSDETILDIGSNWGYSASSIWASGARCKIISFDPIIGFSKCLERLKDLKPGRFDYRITGLGDVSGQIDFYTPVVNGKMLTALTTAQTDPDFDILAQNISTYGQANNGDTDNDFYFYSFRSPVNCLDEILRSDFPDVKIAAAKLDAEGYEPNILRGMSSALKVHTPMLLIEAGNRLITKDFLTSIGFRIAERTGHQLRLTNSMPNAINFFYCHEAKIDSYRERGLLTS